MLRKTGYIAAFLAVVLLWNSLWPVKAYGFRGEELGSWYNQVTEAGRGLWNDMRETTSERVFPLLEKQFRQFYRMTEKPEPKETVVVLSLPSVNPELEQARKEQIEESRIKGQEEASRGALWKVSDEEKELLARIIYAEARGESFEGQVAVGAVVLNRVKNSAFPSTIREVIYQPGQFCVVSDKQINMKPNQSAYQAAEAALAGSDPSKGAVFFYNPQSATDSWIKSRQVVNTIGHHNFCI